MNLPKESSNAENIRSQRLTSVLKEIMLKILIVGDYGVGKTAIIRRYTDGIFSSNYKITIGADFSIKTIPWDHTTQVNIQLWDIAGHEKLGFMTRVYYKYAVGAIVVFDVSRISTFHSIQKWLQDVRDKVLLPDGSPIPVIILANKCDISEVSIPLEGLTKICKQYGVLKWYKTSAKNNLNIDEAVTFLISIAMKNKSKEPIQKTDNLILHKPKVDTQESKCCDG